MNSMIPTRPTARCGFALIAVLTFMALLIAIVMGFFGRATTERSAASGALSAVTARQLADTAVNLVQGQINIATGQGSRVCWTSQPGLIRTFDDSGALAKAYKLYSSSQMISSAVSGSADLPDANWYAMPAIWTDLNAPVPDTAGTKNYPILDGSSSLNGFDASTAPVAPYTGANPVPMPVKWLYVLKDGTLVAPTGSGTSATITGETYAGSPNDLNGNPVVGRIAFWTDDDSCKVNVNTASEGTYWDTPRANTTQEKEYANYQPAQKEFQRYPGHPAMTSLSAVFPDLTRTQIYNIVPRINGGGSDQGTKVATEAVKLDSDRLYSSVDELIFKPTREFNDSLSRQQLERAKFFITAHSRAPEVNLFNLPRIACWPVCEGLESGHVTPFDRLIAFCSTVNSAPYYFQRKDSGSSINDIGISRNRELYAYLQFLTGTAIPGYNGDFKTKYGDDRDQILTEIFDYIRSTNLYDDTLAAGCQFTVGRSGSGTALPGHGWVVPTHYVTASGTTMGFGRSYTLTELGLGFICNAVADDPDTPEHPGIDPPNDESCGSNETSGPYANAVLSGTALNPGEKYIQAILLMKFFSPMHGYTIMAPDMQVKISGLDQLSISKDSPPAYLFPGLTSGTASYFEDPGTSKGGRSAGGFCDCRYVVFKKSAPARGTLPSEDSWPYYPKYPFIGVPIKIKAPPVGETMNFNGGTLTVEFYAGANSKLDPDHLMQTFQVTLPSGTFPIPKIVPKGTGGSAVETTPWFSKQLWWSFTMNGTVRGDTSSQATSKNYGRLNGIASADPGSSTAPNEGSMMRDGYDVIRTVLVSSGDFRLVAGQFSVLASAYKKHRFYDYSDHMSASNLGGEGSQLYGFFDAGGKYIASGVDYNPNFIPDIYAGTPDTPEGSGDYDTGISNYQDGPFINKPDEGSSYRGKDNTVTPYYAAERDANGVLLTQLPQGPTFFSPNRIMPSPGMFGSLPTGVKADVPWRTLLFRPQPGHSGAASPKDHLLLDFFWMPVVEPYAISDRFSTAGKINMNYQVFPFTYIERSIGLRALFQSEMFTAIPDSKSYTYKASDSSDKFRLTIDADQTLQQFETKFKSGEVFKSASEICDLWIVPSGTSLSDMTAFWAAHRMTGDNLREKIYTTLYPRLTTKSNTFTVHFIAQALKKQRGSAAGTWTENKDIVTAEYRGSTTIERFIDAGNTEIPNYAKTPSGIPNMKTLDAFYKWRVVENRQFAP